MFSTYHAQVSLGFLLTVELGKFLLDPLSAPGVQ